MSLVSPNLCNTSTEVSDFGRNQVCAFGLNEISPNLRHRKSNRQVNIQNGTVLQWNHSPSKALKPTIRTERKEINNDERHDNFTEDIERGAPIG